MLLNVAVFTLRLLLLYLVLLYLGFPLRRLVVGRRPDPMGLESVLVGAAAVGVIGWYGSEWSSLGVSGLLPWMLALNVIPMAAALLLRPVDRSELRRRATSAVVPLLVALALAVTVFGLFYPGYFRDDGLGPVSFGNNDIASYALSADHLLVDGFDDVGEFEIHHLGVATKRDHAGSFLFLAFAAASTGNEVWEIVMVSVAFALFVCIAGCASLVTRTSGFPLGMGLLAGAFATSSSIFFYSSYQVFFAHLLGVGVTLVMVVVAIDIARAAITSWSRAIPLVALLAIVEIWLVLAYSHASAMTFPVLVAVAVAWIVGGSSSWRAAVRSSLQAAALLSLALLGPLLVITDRFLDALRVTLAAESAPVGWPLGRVTLMQLLGLSRFPTQPTGELLVRSRSAVLAVAAMAAVILIICGVLLFAALSRLAPGERRSGLLAHATLLAIPVTICVLFYGRYGEGYQGWKGTLFFQPLAPAAAVVALWAGVRFLVPHLPLARVRVLQVGIGVALVVASTAVAAPWRYFPSKFLKLDASTRQVAALVGPELDDVNIDIGGRDIYWDNMWVAYFVEGPHIYSVQPSYISQAPPTSKWTLRLRSDRPRPGERRLKTAGRYALDGAP